MAELLVVSNPKRRKHARRRRKMTAKQLKYFGPKRHRKRAHHRRRRRRHATGSRRPAMGYVQGGKRIRRRKLNPHHRRRHHYRHHRHHRHHARRNPTLRGFTGAIMPTIKAGAWGATGALMLDGLWGVVYPRLGTFSAYLDNPYIGFFAKAAGSVVVGTVGGRMFRGRHTQLAHGAMTVVTHDFLKSLLVQLAPTIFGPGGAVPLGAYLSGSAPIVGTATIPQAYLPFNGITPPQFGAYFSGSSGSTSDSGVYAEDRQGLDPWSG